MLTDRHATTCGTAAATDVLIIEDEPIIAMDIEELVASCGHRVVGVAATEGDAGGDRPALPARADPGRHQSRCRGGTAPPPLSRILRSHYAPVIFVTAYPERLLDRRGTGTGVRHHQAIRGR